MQAFPAFVPLQVSSSAIWWQDSWTQIHTSRQQAPEVLITAQEREPRTILIRVCLVRFWSASTIPKKTRGDIDRHYSVEKYFPLCSLKSTNEGDQSYSKNYVLGFHHLPKSPLNKAWYWEYFDEEQHLLKISDPFILGHNMFTELISGTCNYSRISFVTWLFEPLLASSSGFYGAVLNG
jgi:hypothetical protein